MYYDYHLVVALVVNFTLFEIFMQTPSEILSLQANFFSPISGLHQYICLHILREPERNIRRNFPIYARYRASQRAPNEVGGAVQTS